MDIFPKTVRIHQLFDRDSMENVPHVLKEKIIASGRLNGIQPGDSIAIACGSRGICGIAGIVKSVADECLKIGAKPFVVPAMGSHGGGTAEGQQGILESLGVTEESIGIPIRSSMETVQLGETPSGAPVHFDINASEADGVIVINRVKLHTAYHGDVESGLCKMLAVGLGKRKGAETMHRLGLGDVIVESARVSRREKNILFGVAILENAFDETVEIRVVPPDEFESADADLLNRCRRIIPRIPVPEFDILIVDEIGKNISGAGMDPNVIGFWRRWGGGKEPDYTTLIVRGITPESHGNALGIGLADLTTKKLVDSIDFKATYTNVITSMQWITGRIPVTLENDRECLRIAIEKYDPGKGRVVRIKNTLDLEYLHVSENLIHTLEGRDDIEIVGDPEPIVFDDEGFIV